MKKSDLKSVVNLIEWLTTVTKQDAWSDWRWQLRNSFTADDLFKIGLIRDKRFLKVATLYPVRVTPYYLSLTQWDWHDKDGLASHWKDHAIVTQWLPSLNELQSSPDRHLKDDPFDEKGCSPVPGVVHRFPDRIMVTLSNVCSVYCRHCTRKNMLQSIPTVQSKEELLRAVAFVRSQPQIREVLLSGGDPFMLNDQNLLRAVRAFADLQQIDAVRIGTRILVTLPMRVTEDLARALGAFKKIWINTHFNHGSELTTEATAACARLVDAGIPLSNQTVLLKGINDTFSEMRLLCCGLQRHRIRPYYVFMCDPVKGTEHFHTSLSDALTLEKELASSVGGLAMPRFVADMADADAKVAITAIASNNL